MSAICKMPRTHSLHWLATVVSYVAAPGHDAHAEFFISATRLIETAIALGLLLGFARRITYFAGALFSLLIWSTAEGFGGPYTSGATNVGPALIYALVFITAALFEHLLGPNRLTVSITTLSAGYPRWSIRWSNGRRNASAAIAASTTTGTISSRVIGAIICIVAFALTTLGSAQDCSCPPTPAKRRRRGRAVDLAAMTVSRSA